MNTTPCKHTYSFTHTFYSFCILFLFSGLTILVLDSEPVYYILRKTVYFVVTSLLTFNAFILSNIFKISLWFDAIQAILEKGTLISPLN